jgi:hypothetical protein
VSDILQPRFTDRRVGSTNEPMRYRVMYGQCPAQFPYDIDPDDATDQGAAVSATLLCFDSSVLKLGTGTGHIEPNGWIVYQPSAADVDTPGLWYVELTVIVSAVSVYKSPSIALRLIQNDPYYEIPPAPPITPPGP